MSSEEPLELTLDRAYCSGIAYLKSGDEVYFREENGGIVKATHMHMHPMMYQLERVNPLAEKGRKFGSAEESVHYLEAITAFDMMILEFSSYGIHQSEELRLMAVEEAERLQAKIKKEYLPVLETIPTFEKARWALEVTADEFLERIYEKARSE